MTFLYAFVRRNTKDGVDDSQRQEISALHLLSLESLNNNCKISSGAVSGLMIDRTACV